VVCPVQVTAVVKRSIRAMLLLSFNGKHFAFAGKYK